MKRPRPPGIRLDRPVTDEADHYELCTLCGQAFDRRDLGAVLHHAEVGHEKERRD